MPEGKDGMSTDASGGLKQVEADIEADVEQVDADVEEVEAGVAALSIVAETGTKDRLSRGLGCAARLKVEPHP